MFESLTELFIKNILPALSFLMGAFLYYKGYTLRGRTASKDMLYNQIEAVMIQAEHLGLSGKEKKEYVMDVIGKYVNNHKLNVDKDTISNIIESIMSVANVINRRLFDVDLFKNTNTDEINRLSSELQREKEERRRLEDEIRRIQRS